MEPSTFPLPDPESAQDHAAVRLLLDASRLLLRDGAAPFRSLGHLSVRPRPYQFVPMLMGLRQDTVRLLIADDVGVGKTIEGALIARELLDRGIVTRLAVLCPPYLCEQWQTELAEKFHIDATVIRSGTVSRLERQAPIDQSIFRCHRHFVASIDLVKSEKYRQQFLLYCPRLVLVDEAHGAAAPSTEHRSQSQQQRHNLLHAVAEDPSRHLIMLTATPHSGREESFLSLLGLLRPEFADYRLAELTVEQGRDLASHFVQRRRPDVKKWMGTDTPFPERDPVERTYTFSKEYRAFYGDVYRFARQLVRSSESLSGWKARMRFWSALALLRCVTSSPAAAETSLAKRQAAGEDDLSTDSLDTATDDELTETYEPVVYDPSEGEIALDSPPTVVFDAQERDPAWSDSDRRTLRGFARQAAALRGKADTKLTCLAEAIGRLLSEGYFPIVWCRYIATSEYVADELAKRLSKDHKGLRVTCVNGTMPDDERRLKVEELGQAPVRVLVATDCLSEGINLQAHFNAAVHYDLPWNPNRLEQREGRVDRFGQTSPVVRTVLIFGQDNPVDGAVLDVLLKKAREIHTGLGVHVPVPADSESVLQAVFRSMFGRTSLDADQASLFDAEDLTPDPVAGFHKRWDRAAKREKETRTRFAQRSIKPEEVERELQETDSVLGDPALVREFLRAASQRLGFAFRERKNGIFELGLTGLPDPVRRVLGKPPDPLRISFESPVPERAVYVGRSHALIETLAEHLVDHAFYPTGDTPTAARCGVIRTDRVTRRTTLLLLRLRCLVHERGDEIPSLAEETLVWGYEGLPASPTPLSLDQAKELMAGAAPSANVSSAEKEEVLREVLDGWKALQTLLGDVLTQRGKRLTESHGRVRKLTKQESVRIELQTPPDLLGALLLLPVPKGVQP